MKKVSVIIPVYNAEKYLNENLSALHELDDAEMEFIVVNDGSTDSSLDICNSYARKDSRFRVISKSNGGVSDARNVGLDEARGEYIFFLDSDDKISSEFDECVNESMKFGVDFVFFNRYFLKEERKDLCYDIKMPVFREIEPNILYEVLDVCAVLEQKCFLGGSGSVLLKRELINNVRFDVDRNLLEDYDFFLSIIHKGKFKIHYCNRITVMIQADTPNSLTKKKIHFRENVFLATTNPYLIANKKLGRQLFWVEANFNMQKFGWRDRVKYAGMIVSEYKDFMAINKFSISCCCFLFGININRQRRRLQGAVNGLSVALSKKKEEAS